jgi:hypothetical protein
MAGNADHRRKAAPGICPMAIGVTVLRSAALSALVVAAAMLASAPAQAQFVCTPAGIDINCSNTGTQVGTFVTNDPNAGSTVTVTNTSTGTVAGAAL